MIKPRNVVPSLKDRVTNFGMLLSTIPTGQNSVLFLNPFYDYQIVSMGALVTTITQAVAAPFALGHGPYTDSSGVIQPANLTKFLTAAGCVDINGQPLSTAILPVGTMCFFAMQPDPTGAGLNILPAGAPLVVSGAAVSNSGTVILSVALRPKEKDRNDFTKRPGGAADQAYATYYK